MIEIVGFLAFATNVAGNLMLAWQTIWGWVVRLVSISLWFVYAYNESSPSLIANAVTFFCINIFGLWKWRRDRERERGKPSYEDLLGALYEVTGAARDLASKHRDRHELVYITAGEKILERLDRTPLRRFCYVCGEPLGDRTEICVNHDE